MSEHPALEMMKKEGQRNLKSIVNSITALNEVVDTMNDYTFKEIIDNIFEVVEEEPAIKMLHFLQGVDDGLTRAFITLALVSGAGTRDRTE